MAGLNFSKNQQIALIVIVGLALLGIAYGHFRSSNRSFSESAITVTETDKTASVDIDAPAVRSFGLKDNENTIVVHVVGCVKNPNIYKFSPGSRIADAVQAAGGTTSDADFNAVNLAAKLQDGQQIVIPSKYTAMQAPTLSSRPNTSTGTTNNPSSRIVIPPVSAGMSASSQNGSPIVNINTAGIAELDQLPGVGPATAQKIIDYRNKIGRFNSIDQLLEVKGIGQKKLEQMRPFVSL